MTDYRKRLEDRLAVADRCNERIPVINHIGVGIADLRQLLSEGERMREENAHLRTFITALEDGNMAFLCDELDKAKAENASLRSLLEEAGKVVERCQAVLAIMVKPDMTVSSLSAYMACVEAEVAARTLLTKMKEG